MKSFKLITLAALAATLTLTACGGDEDSGVEITTPSDEDNGEDSTTSDFTYSQFVGTWVKQNSSDNEKTEWGIKFYSDNKTGQAYCLRNGSVKTWDFKWWLVGGNQMRIVWLDGGDIYYTIRFFENGKILWMNDGSDVEIYNKYK